MSVSKDDDESIRLGAWDVVAVVGYFAIILTVGLVVREVKLQRKGLRLWYFLI